MTWLLLTLVLGLQSVLFPTERMPVPKTTATTSASNVESTPPSSITIDASSGLDPWGHS
jgi:hypothetical protein